MSNDQTYVFSYTVPHSTMRIIHPPWWRFWERARLARVAGEATNSVTLDQSAGERLLRLWETDKMLLARILPFGALNLQLEQGNQPSAYIPTHSVKAYPVDMGDDWLKAVTK